MIKIKLEYQAQFNRQCTSCPIFHANNEPLIKWLLSKQIHKNSKCGYIVDNVTKKSNNVQATVCNWTEQKITCLYQLPVPKLWRALKNLITMPGQFKDKQNCQVHGSIGTLINSRQYHIQSATKELCTEHTQLHCYHGSKIPSYCLVTFLNLKLSSALVFPWKHSAARSSTTDQKLFQHTSNSFPVVASTDCSCVPALSSRIPQCTHS